MGASEHHQLGAERHLRDVLAFFGALVVPTAAYLSARDFSDGVPGEQAAGEQAAGEQAAGELDAAIASALALAAAAIGPLGPPPLAVRRP